MADNPKVRARPPGRSRRLRRAFTAFAVVAGLFVPAMAGLPPAHAASLPLTFDHIAGLPRHGTPEGVAVDASGNVYVSDTNASNSSGDDRIVKYSSDGSFLDVIAGDGTAVGSVANPTAIAISPASGHNLYVAESGYTVGGSDPGDDRVQSFDLLGNALASWGTHGGASGRFSSPQGIAVDSVGNVYIADSGNKRVQKFDSGGGGGTTWDFANAAGPYFGTAVYNRTPSGLAIDSSDVVWMTDGSKVYRFSAAGSLLSSFAASGATGIAIDASDDAWVASADDVVRQYDANGNVLATLGSAGQLLDPQGVAVHGSYLYVADTGDGRIVRFSLPSPSTSWSVTGVSGVAVGSGTVYAADGSKVRTYDTAGNAGATWDSSGSSGVAVDGSGNVWVSSTSDGVVREYDASGTPLLTAVGAGTLTAPKGIAVAAGKLYVADSGKVYRFSSDGSLDTSWTVSGSVTVAGATGVAVGGTSIYVTTGSFVRPFAVANGSSGTGWSLSPASATDIAIDGSGNFWLSSSTDNVVREFTSAHIPLATLGIGSLSSPGGVAFANGLFVADHGNDKVVRYTFGGYDLDWGEYPGPGVEDLPTGVATDAANNVYVTNRSEDVIQKFDASGNFVTQWGGSGAGPLVNPGAIAVGPSGDVYVADTGNDRIQQFSSTGTFIRTWGAYGTDPTKQQMIAPAGIAIDQNTGSVYVSTYCNNGTSAAGSTPACVGTYFDRLVKYTATGTYVADWGTFGNGGADGTMYEPRGLAVDATGNLWVADSRNNRVQVFDTSTNPPSFLAKWGGSGSNGVSTSSLDGKFARPYDLDVDAQGQIWVVDHNNNRIQSITPAGVFQSKLGSLGLDTYDFDSPSGLAIDAAGRVLVADTNNDRVSVFVDQNGPDTTFTNGPGSASNSTSATFDFGANELGATFECTLDGGGSGPWVACSPPDTITGLTEGTHAFYVRASDAATNVGNPTEYDWTIDLTNPSLTVDSSPSSPTTNTSAAFTFHSNEGGIFKCSLDSAPATTCTSPFSQPVADGSHSFSVYALDSAGNASSTASHTWTVDTTPPTVHITSGPSGYTTATDATFQFTSPDAATYTCQLDSATPVGCNSGSKSFSGLGAGQHTFSVYGTDALLNQGAPATRSWTVDLNKHRPDALIATSNAYAGNNVYNSTGKNQTKTLKAKSGTTITYKLRVENDGDDTDTYTFLGGGSVKGYTVSYFIGTSDYTKKVTDGTPFSIAKGTYKYLTMKVKVGSSGKASASFLFKVTSGHDPSKVDAVKAVVKRG